MSNTERGNITITLDRERTLRYDFNAWVEIEDKLGLRPEDLAGREMKLSDIRFFLWAGLIHEDPSLTEREVGSMIDLENIDHMLSQITEAFGLSFEQVEPDPNPESLPAKNRKAGTGKSSKK